jgi:hypothetical protein
MSNLLNEIIVPVDRPHGKLHPHIGMGRKLGLDPDHVIVDKDDWDEVLKYLWDSSEREASHKRGLRKLWEKIDALFKDKNLNNADSKQRHEEIEHLLRWLGA